MTTFPDPPRKRTGTRSQRLLLYVAAGLLTFFLLWFWSFVLNDIGSVAIADVENVEKAPSLRELEQEKDNLSDQENQVSRTIRNLQENQKILRDSTDSTRETMNQLLQNQKQLAEKNIALSPAEQESIAESQKLFLENQKKYQDLNAEITSQTAARRKLEQQIQDVNDRLRPLQQSSYKQQQQLYRSASLKAAAMQLAILLPLLFVALWLVTKKRNTAYGILVYPFAISLFLKLMSVVHEYFPSRYFKYTALLGLIAALVALVVYLIRMITRPRPDLLLKQRREAYEKKECPQCAYPIQRGWLKEAGITGKSKTRIIALPTSIENAKAEPYACPSCGEHLYEECTQCHHIRYSLLPYCEYCGSEKSL